MTGVDASPWKAIKDGIRLGVVIGFFAMAAVLLQRPWVREQLFDIGIIRDQLRSLGYNSFLIFILFAALVNALGVPRIWISVVAGTLYGAVQGIGIAMAATLSGASLNFWMARTLLRGPVLRRMPSRMQPWMEKLRRQAFLTILYLRLFPFTNATLTNLLAGASTMRFKSFFAATILGFIPFTVIFATFGSSAAKHNNLQLLIAAILLTVVSIVQWYYTRKYKHDQTNHPNPALAPVKDQI